jgi:dephospho-CoA kinase
VIAIGLTGGIGSGKSAVAARLQALGASIVDTDVISHELTGPSGGAMPAVRAAFGDRFIGPDGALDRAAMRTLAFEDTAARGRLEAILHPAIRASADAELAQARGPYAIVVVPLLFETRGYLDRVSRVLVVDCPEPLQVERTMRRSSLDESAVRAILAAQWPRWRRLQAADDVIWNGGSEQALGERCAEIHNKYLEISGGRG